MCSSKSLVNILKIAHNHLCNSLRNESQFKTRPVRTEYFEQQSVMYLGQKIWELPPNLRNLETVTAFKRGIKKWKPEKCPCRQCKARLVYRKLVLFKSFCFHLLNKFNLNILVLVQFVLEKSFGNNEYHRETSR